MMRYKERLDEAEARFNELTGQMADHAVISDSEQYRKVSKAQSELANSRPSIANGSAPIGS